MVIVFLTYGAAFFCLGIVTALESRRASELPLSRHLPWLAGFGIVHSLVEWIDMLILIGVHEPWRMTLVITRICLLPLSAILLIRFGAGLIAEAGPMPEYLLFFPLILIIPIGILFGYAITTATELPFTAIDIWSRYLLYFSGCVLTAYGFLRQWREMSRTKLSQARNLMFGAALAFGFNAVVAGLIVPAASFGLAGWLNYDTVLAATGVPVQIWRMASAVVVTILVIRALGIFETEREQRLDLLQEQRREAEQKLHRERRQAQDQRLEDLMRERHGAESWATALVDISRRIANLDNVDEMLLTIAEEAQRLLASDVVSIGLLDEPDARLTLRCQAFGGKVFSVDNPPIIESATLRSLLESGVTQSFPEGAELTTTDWYCPTVARKIRNAAVAPVQFDGNLIGGLWTGRLNQAAYSEHDLAVLDSLADQTVIVLQHALMTTRMQSVAVMEERSRIAREMHDSLAQILGYLGLQMQTLEALTKQGRQDQLLVELAQTRNNIREAQDDVRESILSLRTTLADETGLIPALEEYVTEFGAQTGTDACFSNRLTGTPNLAPLAEVQLVRIVQEALANVRKHAQARRVNVVLSTADDRLHVLIRDDGNGFRLTEERHQFGLKTMRERAETVGGLLVVDSTPGKGTIVSLQLPLLTSGAAVV